MFSKKRLFFPRELGIISTMFAEGDREIALYSIAVMSFFTYIAARWSGDNEVLVYPLRPTCEFTSCRQSISGLGSCVSMKVSSELFLLMIPLQFHCHIRSCSFGGLSLFLVAGVLRVFLLVIIHRFV